MVIFIFVIIYYLILFEFVKWVYIKRYQRQKMPMAKDNNGIIYQWQQYQRQNILMAKDTNRKKYDYQSIPIANNTNSKKKNGKKY